MSTAFIIKTTDRISSLFYGWLRSKTGSSNSSVRNMTELGFQIRSFLYLYPNVEHWKNNKEIFPAVVQIQTINRCNGACRMCPYPYTTHQEEERSMPDDLWQKIIKECAQESSCKILVPMSKNEPLLDKKLPQRINQFRQIAQPHQITELVTNGELLDGKLMKELTDSGLDLITISLNATNKETYQKTMHNLNWEKVQKNIKEIEELDLSKTNIFVRLIRQKDNYQEVKAFKKYWKKRGFNVLIYGVNNRSGAVKKFEQLLEPFNWFERIKRKILSKLSKKIFPICPYSFSMGNILSNGDMPLCVNDWHNREIIGNVRNQTIKEIYNSPKVNKLRKMMCQGRYDEIAPCKNCSLWKNNHWF